MKPILVSQRPSKVGHEPWHILPFALTGSGVAVAAHRWMSRWGSTDDERARALPGDDFVEGAIQTTLAITIDAPPEAVRPWWRPFDLIIYEPAHFIMETGVLRGIRDRAERRSRNRMAA